MAADLWPDNLRRYSSRYSSAMRAASEAPTCFDPARRKLRPSVRCAYRGCARSQVSTPDQRSDAARRAPSAGWVSDCPKRPISPDQRQQRRRCLRIDPASWQPPSAPERQEECHLGVIEKWPQEREPQLSGLIAGRSALFGTSLSKAQRACHRQALSPTLWPAARRRNIDLPG